MQHILAGSRVRLTFLQDRRELAEINWPSVYEDLADAGTPMNYSRWCDLDALTHVVLATDRVTGCYAGVLGVTERATYGQRWLLVEVALVRPLEPEGMLMRALLAHVLARIACLDGKPAAIAAPRASKVALDDLCQALAFSELYPPMQGNVIPLRTAHLSRGIGIGMTVLDLRPVPEDSLLRDLRELHGLRSGRLKPIAMPAGKTGAMAKPARSAGAMRRPRKATQTGRTG